MSKETQATEATETVSSAWLTQLRNAYVDQGDQLDVLQRQLNAATQWQPMSTAPVDRRILLKRPRWHGGPAATNHVGIGRYELQQFHKTPRPYWTDDQAFYSVAENRKSTPIGWREIPQ